MRYHDGPTPSQKPGHGKVEPQPHDCLIWVLLAPTSSEEPYKSQYDAAVERLVTALRAEEGLWHVTHLVNQGPPSVPHCAPSMIARASRGSLLVQAKPNDFGSTHPKLQSFLEHGNTAVEAGPIVRWSINTYELVQNYEPRTSKSLTGTCVVTVSIQPSPGQETEVDSWYRKDTLPLLGATSPELFLRCRRYKRVETSGGSGQLGAGGSPEMLAVNEYLSVKALFQHALTKGPVVEETERSKRVLGGARKVERTVWEVV
ncbi:uncharacterized protein LTR77_007493 [Saxophila tyrrhenica]|uniref:Uncharacterized protein n=1 Tax=Saxophila tyrrhenica TaxID=1690608 RepID=A0AAV9P7U1_9PEZI|nr:hypothetical protein LTR77_007493 [Saxophila tyrrhenica]